MTVQELHDMTRVLIERGHADTRIYVSKLKNGRLVCTNFQPEMSGVKVTKTGIVRDINGIKALIG